MAKAPWQNVSYAWET